MAILKEQKKAIKKQIMNILNIEKRIDKATKDYYGGDRSPFLVELFSDINLIRYKVIHSIYTAMGMSLFENVCKIVSESYGNTYEKKEVFGIVPESVNRYLDTIEKKTYQPNRDNELKEIKSLCKKDIKKTKGKNIKYKSDLVDVYITTPANEEILIGITTVKPNMEGFRNLRKKHLKWSAQRWSQNPEAKVNSYIGIPYNPFSMGDHENVKYDRWSDCYDRKDILVGTELWKKVSNDTVTGTDLADIFSSIGDTMKERIEQQMSSIK